MIFGEKGNEALIYLYILGLGPLLIAIKSCYGANKMLIFKHDKLYKKIVTIYSLIGFIFALILIPLFEGIGAAVTVITTWIIMAIMYYYKSLKIKVTNE